MQSADRTDFDVAILGSGISGSSLAAILARHGLRVVILEAGEHPRFSIGESMILETSETLRAMAEFYDVPELRFYSSEAFLPEIGMSYGVKRHFSYLHHAEARVHDPRHCLQAVIPREPYGHELHLYRQDSDYQLATIAVQYGATLRQRTRVEKIEISENGVEIVTRAGAIIRVDYVLDAGGFGSVLAKQFSLRHQQLETHSRGLYTHMVGVPCFNDVGPSRRDYGIPFPLCQGTLHHVFEGGWLWLIPFDNHPRSTNPRCSVGLMLDPRIHPENPNRSPEEEFFAFVARFPSIAAQFRGARAVLPWSRSKRIQASSHETVGDRYCLLGNAVGFVDPLFSKGLYSSLASVNLLAGLLIENSRTGDYSRAAFLPLEKQSLSFIAANDRLVSGAYRSFSHPDLWAAYSVLWLTGAYLELLKLTTARIQATTIREYRESTRDLALVGGGFEEFTELSRQVREIIEQADPQEASDIGAACRAMNSLYQQTPWIPYAFKAVARGRNHLPSNKFRPALLRQDGGFLGTGAFRDHFFGNLSLARISRLFISERLEYSPSIRSLRKRLGRKSRPDFGRIARLCPTNPQPNARGFS